MERVSNVLAKEIMNSYGVSKTPFLFILDYDLRNNIIVPLDQLADLPIAFEINDRLMHCKSQKAFSVPHYSQTFAIKSSPISYEQYVKAYQIVKENLGHGNSFLANLTSESQIEIDASLEELFMGAKAPYKLLIEEEFVCFSPETFVQITETGEISSFPMKGTADGSKEGAAEALINDLKEKYEHTTIVNLIRNDISAVAEKVWVERFRYLDTIQKADGQKLLQMSSEIKGQLPKKWSENIGDLLFKLLPAGSITGAPKPKTMEIIAEAERLTYGAGQKRGYYTGVFGVFDGCQLSSAVMIRFIEKKEGVLSFKSGGGLTFRSDALKEYEELISKIYVPIL